MELPLNFQMKKHNLVFWNRHFRNHITKKMYRYFDVPKGTSMKDILSGDEYPEIKILFRKLGKSRLDMAKAGFISGTPFNRKTNEQYVFNTSTHTLNMPYVEYQHYPEWDMDDVTDAMMASAQILADTGKTIDLFWSGGLDSTGALIALNEICPKQLRVIIGGYTEYPEYYDKVVKHLDHVIDDTGNLMSMAKPDKHVFCPCGQGDELFGAPGARDREALEKYTDTREKILVNWELTREYNWATGGLRFIQEFSGDKMDMENHLQLYAQKPLEKWAINQHRTGLESELFTGIPPKGDHWNDEHYTKWKIPLRKFLYKYTKDKEYSFNKKKIISLDRGQNNLQKYNNNLKGYRVWAVLEDGTILTKDNIDQYDWRGFLHHYKDEWN